MLPSEIYTKRILLSSLNWGMGHVSRCIPLIDILKRNGNDIIIAASEAQKGIFRFYFPDLQFVDHAGYPFNFGKNGNFGLDLAKQFIPLKKRLKLELDEVDRLVDQYSIDLIISDHRYGFRSKKVYSIVLTHQLNLPVKWYEGWVQRAHHGYLKSFNEVWVPDTLTSELAGELSINRIQLNATYIGVLSRFSLYNPLPKKMGGVVLLISGPEIYARQFLIEQIGLKRHLHERIKLILPEAITIEKLPLNFEVIPSNNWLKCDEEIAKASKIVSRSGYSTLMDLAILKTPFEITPTPGQREQEYLCDLWNEKALGQSTS